MAVHRELDQWASERVSALLTIQQAARILNVGRSTVYNLIDDGRLEVVHIGRSARIPADSVSALVAQLRDAQARGDRPLASGVRSGRQGTKSPLGRP